MKDTGISAIFLQTLAADPKLLHPLNAVSPVLQLSNNTVYTVILSIAVPDSFCAEYGSTNFWLLAFTYF